MNKVNTPKTQFFPGLTKVSSIRAETFPCSTQMSTVCGTVIANVQKKIRKSESNKLTFWSLKQTSEEMKKESQFMICRVSAQPPGQCAVDLRLEQDEHMGLMRVYVMCMADWLSA